MSSGFIWTFLVNVTELADGVMTAAGSMIVRLTRTDAEPPVLFAQIVHSPCTPLVDGMPEIIPVLRLNSNPAGSAGPMAKDAITPPLLVMVIGEIEIVRMRVEAVFEILMTAMGSLMVIVMVVEAAPPELFAHTVQV